MSEKKLEIFNILNLFDNGYDLDYILNKRDLHSFSSNKECVDYLVGECYLSSESGEILTENDLVDYTVSQLKDMLRKHNLKVSGKKQELIERLLSVNESKKESLDDFVISNNYELTEKSKSFLKENQWIDLYNFALVLFRFEDYEFYVKNSSDDMVSTAFKFCDEVLSRSLVNNQFLVFITALSAKAHVYAYIGDYESFLDYDLQRFILGLNPISLDMQTYSTYSIIDPANIINLRLVTEQFDFGRLKSRFDKIWVKSNIKNVTVPKKTSFKYLKRAIDGVDVEELNMELREKFFNKKFGL